MKIEDKDISTDALPKKFKTLKEELKLSFNRGVIEECYYLETMLKIIALEEAFERMNKKKY